MPTTPQTVPRVQRGLYWWRQTSLRRPRSNHVGQPFPDFRREMSASIFSESRAPDRGRRRSYRRSTLCVACSNEERHAPFAVTHGFGEQTSENKKGFSQ
jgi:hypothetical protein